MQTMFVGGWKGCTHLDAETCGSVLRERYQDFGILYKNDYLYWNVYSIFKDELLYYDWEINRIDGNLWLFNIKNLLSKSFGQYRNTNLFNYSRIIVLIIHVHLYLLLVTFITLYFVNLKQNCREWALNRRERSSYVNIIFAFTILVSFCDRRPERVLSNLQVAKNHFILGYVLGVNVRIRKAIFCWNFWISRWVYSER